MDKTRIGIVGYGNLGKGVELAIAQTKDMELTAIFSRRQLDHSLYQPMDGIDAWKDQIDVMLLCGGSATDLPEQGPALASCFCIVDSYDTHARIPEYFTAVDAVATTGKKIAVIATGWDPGLFSMMRVLAESILPRGKCQTFWGRGVSQGHSDAVRRVPGVIDARQYTIPSEAALQKVRDGNKNELTTREKHTRQCFVVLKEGADSAAVTKNIVSMPDYFAEYDTTVEFITQEEMQQNHAGLPHGGFVLHNGETGENHQQLIEFGIKLDSNPEFTASVLVACARAAHRLHQRGESGARTVFDLPIGLLSPNSPEDLRRDRL